MSSIPELLRQYEFNLNQGIAAQGIGNVSKARDFLLLAVERLFEIAQLTVIPELRDARVKQANGLLDDVEALLAKPAPQKGQIVAGDAEPQDAKRWLLVEKPGVRFVDIAGLHDAKAAIQRRVIDPLLHPETAARWKKSVGGGVLLYGPPGNGKTMLAKAIATELDAPFFSVKCSDVMSKWVGEAEQNLNQLFESVRAYELAVVFFDETEALVSSRGKGSTVMDRLIPEFLSQIDGISSGDDRILLLGATNRPWDMDQAAIRPGRFGDEIIYIGLPDAEARLNIIAARLDGIPMAEDVKPAEVAQSTQGYSGADIVALFDRATDRPYSREIQTGMPHILTLSDVTNALDVTTPSVSEKSIARYRKWMENKV